MIPKPKKRRVKKEFSFFTSACNNYWYFIGMRHGQEVTGKVKAATQDSAKRKGQAWADKYNANPSLFGQEEGE